MAETNKSAFPFLPISASLYFNGHFKHFLPTGINLLRSTICFSSWFFHSLICLVKTNGFSATMMPQLPSFLSGQKGNSQFRRFVLYSWFCYLFQWRFGFVSAIISDFCKVLAPIWIFLQTKRIKFWNITFMFAKCFWRHKKCYCFCFSLAACSESPNGENIS